jgi:hypothetical protein
MPDSDDPVEMTSQARFHEVAGILAAGFLHLRCRRGYVPETLPDPPEPTHMATHSAPEKAAGILRN